MLKVKILFNCVLRKTKQIYIYFFISFPPQNVFCMEAHFGKKKKKSHVLVNHNYDRMLYDKCQNYEGKKVEIMRKESKL